MSNYLADPLPNLLFATPNAICRHQQWSKADTNRDRRICRHPQWSKADSNRDRRICRHHPKRNHTSLRYTTPTHRMEHLDTQQRQIIPMVHPNTPLIRRHTIQTNGAEGNIHRYITPGRQIWGCHQTIRGILQNTATNSSRFAQTV